MKKLSLTSVLAVIMVFTAIVSSFCGEIQKSRIDKLPNGWNVTRVLPAVTDIYPEWYEYDKYYLKGFLTAPKGKYIWDLEKAGKLVFLDYELTTLNNNVPEGEVLHWLRQWFDCDPQLIRVNNKTPVSGGLKFNFKIIPSGFCDGYTGYDRYQEKRGFPLGWELPRYKGLVTDLRKLPDDWRIRWLIHPNTPDGKGYPICNYYDFYYFLGQSLRLQQGSCPLGWLLSAEGRNGLVHMLEVTTKRCYSEAEARPIVASYLNCNKQLLIALTPLSIQEMVQEGENYWRWTGNWVMVLLVYPSGYVDGYNLTPCNQSSVYFYGNEKIEKPNYVQQAEIPLPQNTKEGFWKLGFPADTAWYEYDIWYERAKNLGLRPINPSIDYVWETAINYRGVLKCELSAPDYKPEGHIRHILRQHFNCDGQLVRAKKMPGQHNKWEILLIPQGWCDGLTLNPRKESKYHQ